MPRVIPENVQKKAARDAKLSEARKNDLVNAKKDRANKRKVYAANADKYAKEYAATARNLIEARRAAKADGGFFVEDDAKIAFVIRTRGVNKLDPKCKKILRLLRLRQLHNGVFVKLNKATINMVRRVEPYITYGYPSQATIRKLIYKRGYGKVNSSRIPLVENAIVEKVLGEHGIVCVEDLIHEISTVGPHFKEANNFLWPFKLSSPLKGFAKKRHPYQAGGAFGNREELINELILRMM
eukprot:NODE_3311_length_788_cov_139.863329_g2768_i0.p2 GENE.NODE_3311_length_788_cov_139.863329_g2768_i0~~NODE_3311_length_788_cov_139.863329_g2768_i0.p2  ORF type:complete len:253 (-),score=65.46 NODE_3311_length_788_cov_139.863329_g2768_i0:30-749(-)